MSANIAVGFKVDNPFVNYGKLSFLGAPGRLLVTILAHRLSIWRPRVDPKHKYGVAWASLGVDWRSRVSLWTPLWRLWMPLWRLRAPIGRSWGSLGRLWAALRRLWVSLGREIHGF